MTIAYAGLNGTTIGSIERSVRAYLWYHSGVWCQFADHMSVEEIDARAATAGTRLLDEGHITAVNMGHRTRTMHALVSQVTEEVMSDQRDVITLDADIIRLAYHIPAHVPEGLEEEDMMGEFNDLGIAFNSWDHFLTDYRRLALHLERHYEATLEQFKQAQRPFLSTAYWRYAENFDQDQYFDGPEYRVTGVSDEYTRNVRTCLESSQAGLLVRVRGQITNISTIRASYYSIGWRCSATNAEGDECGFITDVRQDDYNDDMISPPRCGNDECGAPPPVANFMLVEAPRSKERRIRRAFIQEEMVDSSDTPTVLVEFRDSATKQVEPGEVVTIVGYVRSRPTDSKSKKDRNRELYIVATGIESNEQSRDFVVAGERREEIEAWAASQTWEQKVETLTKSFASEIHGRDKVKQGLILQQCGGSHNTFGLRSDIHVFMLGDPGTGKSVLVDYVRDMHPGSRYLTGERATKAGLIAGMGTSGELFGSSDKRIIQPGALALTPPGAVCIIDEAQHLGSQPGDLLAELNTALEKQEVSVSMTLKAKIPTKTPVILVANPKTDNAKFDPTDAHRPIIDQANVKESTLSRMDVVYFIFDEGVGAEEEFRRASSIFDKMDGVDPASRSGEILPRAFMRDFFSVARTFRNVVFTDEAKRMLVENQVAMRQANTEDQVSQRRAASLARLAQAAAKLDFSETVESRHAALAIEAMSGAEQDRNPTSIRGALLKETRDMKAHIWEAMMLIHGHEGKDVYEVMEIHSLLPSVWNNEWGTGPSMTQVNTTLEALSADETHGRFGSIRRVKKNQFAFTSG